MWKKISLYVKFLKSSKKFLKFTVKFLKVRTKCLCIKLGAYKLRTNFITRVQIAESEKWVQLQIWGCSCLGKPAVGVHKYCQNTRILKAMAIIKIETSVDIESLELVASIFANNYQATLFYMKLLNKYICLSYFFQWR